MDNFIKVKELPPIGHLPKWLHYIPTRSIVMVSRDTHSGHTVIALSNGTEVRTDDINAVDLVTKGLDATILSPDGKQKMRAEDERIRNSKGQKHRAYP